ncbi:MAG: DCC1-like thiol-disulfide oxidoreductase family protein [Flavobacteriaceae bacterium]
MFKKIRKTAYSPPKSTLYWDRDCSFCLYWKLRLQRVSGEKIDFVPYQEAAENFKDIPLKEFKKASRLIEADGQVFSGPDSAFRSLYLLGVKKWHLWYKKHPWFQYLCDHGYNHIAKNRAFYFKITKALFGSNPRRPKPYWVFYLLLLFVFLVFLV